MCNVCVINYNPDNLRKEAREMIVAFDDLMVHVENLTTCYFCGCIIPRRYALGKNGSMEQVQNAFHSPLCEMNPTSDKYHLREESLLSLS